MWKTRRRENSGAEALAGPARGRYVDAMNQLPLFDFGMPAPEPAPVDVDYVRKHVKAIERTARHARFMPWTELEAAKWERFLPDLCHYLPPEEGEALKSSFAAELARLRAATPD